MELSVEFPLIQMKWFLFVVKSEIISYCSLMGQIFPRFNKYLAGVV